MGHIHLLDEIFALMRCLSINFGVAGLFAFASQPGNGLWVFFLKTLLLQTILGPFQNRQVFGS